jgi:hypothetical protein
MLKRTILLAVWCCISLQLTSMAMVGAQGRAVVEDEEEVATPAPPPQGAPPAGKGGDEVKENGPSGEPAAKEGEAAPAGQGELV